MASRRPSDALELRVRGDSLGRSLRAEQRGARFGNVPEDSLLLRRVSLHRLHQIGDQIGASLQHHVHLRPLPPKQPGSSPPSDCAGLRTSLRYPAPQLPATLTRSMLSSFTPLPMRNQPTCLCKLRFQDMRVPRNHKAARPSAHEPAQRRSISSAIFITKSR